MIWIPDPTRPGHWMPDPLAVTIRVPDGVRVSNPYSRSVIFHA